MYLERVFAEAMITMYLCLFAAYAQKRPLFDCLRCAPFPLALPSTPHTPMHSWTTDDEFKWLDLWFPQWHARKLPQNKGFVKRTTIEFLAAFPASKAFGAKLNGVSTAFIPTSRSHSANLGVGDSTMVPLPGGKRCISQGSHSPPHPLLQILVKDCSPHTPTSIYAVLL